jgi:tetratricopeptide (TPR) repeat protein
VIQQRSDQQIGLGAGLALLADHSDNGFDDSNTQASGLTLAQAQAGTVPAASAVQVSLTSTAPLGQPVREAIALNQVGWYAARLNDFDTARDHCQAALSLHRTHHNPEGEAATLDSLGLIAHRTGDQQQAVDHYQQARILYRALGDTYRVADTLDNAGHPHIALGQHDQARAVWQEALELYREQGRDEDAARVQQQLADLALATEPTRLSNEPETTQTA